MAYEQKPGDISVFKNDRKTEGDKLPNYSGTGLGLDGKPIKIALWLKEGKKGKFFSGRIQVDDYAMKKGGGSSTASDDLPDDEIPF